MQKLVTLIFLTVVAAHTEVGKRYSPSELAFELYYECDKGIEDILGRVSYESELVNKTWQANLELEEYVQSLQDSMNSQLFRYWPRYWKVSTLREVVYEDAKRKWSKFQIRCEYYNIWNTLEISDEIAFPFEKVGCFLLRLPFVVRTALLPEFQKLVRVDGFSNSIAGSSAEHRP